MISIFISFCLLNEPNKCVDKQYDAVSNGLPYVCMREAQQQAALYLEEHPDYTVSKWKCGKQESKI